MQMNQVSPEFFLPVPAKEPIFRPLASAEENLRASNSGHEQEKTSLPTTSFPLRRKCLDVEPSQPVRIEQSGTVLCVAAGTLTGTNASASGQTIPTSKKAPTGCSVTTAATLPAPTPRSKPLSAMIKGYSDAAKIILTSSESSTTKASSEEATAETSAGLQTKKRRKSDSTHTKEEADVKSTEKAGEFKQMQQGCAYCLRSKLGRDTTPNKEKMIKMRQAGLVVLSKNEATMAINVGWTSGEVVATTRQRSTDGV
ncbi:hypothetical protein C8R46DRAFT_1043449 [Mycena filopes]|nr:hypothetical protein C8R46DRAFT_1043449 [Mycena filopes]